MGFMDDLDAILAQRNASSSSFRNTLLKPRTDLYDSPSESRPPSAWSSPIPYPSAPVAKPDEGGFGSFGGGWDGLVDNPIGRFTGLNGLLDTVGHGFQKFEDTTGISNVNGFIRGALSTPPSAHPVSTDSYFGMLKDMGGSLVDSLGEMLQGGVAGFKDPHQADAQFDSKFGRQALEKMGLDPVAAHTMNFLSTAGTDPIMTFAPVGKIGSVLAKTGAKGASMIPSVRSVLDGRIAERAGKVFDENVPVPERPAPTVHDEAAAENINRWAGVEGDPVAPTPGHVTK
jgi:hypothetical protein